MSHDTNRSLISLGLLAAGLGFFARAASGQIYVANYGTNAVNEYDLSGNQLMAPLVPGLSGPTGLAISGSDLYVANFTTGVIGEYTTSGAPISPSLITGLSLNGPDAMTVAGATFM